MIDLVTPRKFDGKDFKCIKELAQRLPDMTEHMYTIMCTYIFQVWGVTFSRLAIIMFCIKHQYCKFGKRIQHIYALKLPCIIHSSSYKCTKICFTKLDHADTIHSFIKENNPIAIQLRFSFDSVQLLQILPLVF